MSAAAILEAAGRLLKDPNRWCQGNLACGRTGRATGPQRVTAHKWCAVGACYQVTGVAPDKTDTRADLIKALAYLDAWACQLHRHTIGYVNDHLGHDAVLAVYRAAWRDANSTEQRSNLK